ncbi:hypothetical protein NP493_30g01016 [Ridgeia piscesae]|uniref:Uncharacterized protein n=1 Tax=Ridgeia piscesae TaxID=27915 RepID=A0AAD9PD48_RIDPI|nr:hypothetical protein NP493_30g01016 [Ridgeia piscesae]
MGSVFSAVLAFGVIVVPSVGRLVSPSAGGLVAPSRGSGVVVSSDGNVSAFCTPTFSFVFSFIFLSYSLTSSIVNSIHSSIHAKACLWPSRRMSRLTLCVKLSTRPCSPQISNFYPHHLVRTHDRLRCVLQTQNTF